MSSATPVPPVRTIVATINYVASGSFINRRFVAPGIEHNTGRYEAHRVSVRDGRVVRDRFSLDVNGFVLADRPTTVRDFFDKDEVERTYPAEVVALVLALTGATRVAPSRWRVLSTRKPSRPARDSPGSLPRACGVRDEVLMFKFHDSDSSKALRTPHTAFHDPSFAAPKIRESIEFRTIAYFE